MMVSTMERGSVFTATRSFSHTGVANRSSDPLADDDVFPPSRSGSFISTSSSTSRRIGVVNERQLDSLQKRLINEATTVPVDSSDSVASNSSSQYQQPPLLSGHKLHRLAPMPTRRPMTAEHNRLAVQSSASSGTVWRSTTAGQLAAELERNSVANTRCRNGPTPNPQIDRISSQMISADSCLNNGKYYPAEYAGTLPRKSDHFRLPIDAIDRRRSVSVCDFAEVSSGSRNELESRLIEREAELRSLRETMERNEWAILKVLEDQRRRSNAETTAWRAEWTRKLDELSKKASMEQRLLSDTIEQLQTENTQLKTALATTTDRLRFLERCQKEYIDSSGDFASTHYETIPVARQLSAPEIVSVTTCNDVRRQVSLNSETRDAKSNSLSSVGGQSIYAFLGECFSGGSLRKSESSYNKLIDTENRPQPVNVESSVQTAGLDSHQSRQGSEADGSTGFVEGNENSKVGNSFPFSAASSVETVQNCNHCDDRLEIQRLAFDDERRQWLEEKERVIAYQKLLQLGYVQLVKRCDYLEHELKQRKEHGAGITDDSSRIANDNSSEMDEKNLAPVISKHKASTCVC